MNLQCPPEVRALHRSIPSSHKDSSARPKLGFLKSALQAAEKLLSFVGRAFRHDIQVAFSSGVLTPEGLKPHFSATCLAAEVEFGCGSAALFSSENASCSGGGLGGPAYKKQFADADLFSRTHARKIHCTPSRNPDAKTAAKRLWSRLEVTQPLFTPSPYEGLAVRRVACSTRGLHRQECLCYRTRHSKPN